VAGTAVGWVGFAPMGKALPPEAARFLHGQVRVLAVSLLLALGLGGLLAYLLARHLSRPVRALDGTVVGLTQGRFEERCTVVSNDEIGRLARNVNRLAAVLEKNRSARQRWMADIAHELRTPVAILKGEVEALADGLRQPDARSLSSLHEEIEQLSVLVDDLQTLAMADAGALNLRLEPLDLHRLAGQVAESFRERLAARGIALECRFDTRTGESATSTASIEGDPQRLRQLLHNLLENCARYAEPDGRVLVALRPDDGGLLLSVEDSGPGVADASLERLFERLYRIEQARSRAGGGSGLGLAICRSIVEAHGGRISAARSALGGLRIASWLPA
jgi:two-component system sensor histidine kinase BaeS